MTWFGGKLLIMAEVDLVSLNPAAPFAFLAQSTEDLEKIDEFVETASRSVTARDIAIAVLILLITWPAAVFLGRLAKRAAARIPGVSEYLPPAIGRLVSTGVSLFGVAAAVGALGVDVQWITLVVIVSLIITVLMIRPLIENLASGLLLTARPAFSVGDEIVTNGHTGRVIEINARSTVLRTQEAHRIHIPNGDVLDEPLIVYSAFKNRRSDLDIEIDYRADTEKTKELIVAAAESVPHVAAEPSPVVRAKGFGNGTVILSLRWFHQSNFSARTQTLDGVVLAVKQALDNAGVEMPSPELVVRQPDTSPLFESSTTNGR